MPITAYAITVTPPSVGGYAAPVAVRFEDAAAPGASPFANRPALTLNGSLIGDSDETLISDVTTFYFIAATAVNLHAKVNGDDVDHRLGLVPLAYASPLAIALQPSSSGADLPDLASQYQSLTTRNVVWVVGDSLTAGAPRGVSADSNAYGSSSTLHGGLMYQDTTWLPWALAASQARWTFGGFAATGGYTAAQILATHVPSVIAAATAGDVVVVFAGTNGNVVADVQSIHAAFRNAGLRTVAVTIPPSTSSTLTAVAQFNRVLADYCLKHGIPLVDAHSVVVDTATGAQSSTYNVDGVHPNALGFQAIGAAIATVLNAIFPAGTQNLATHDGVVTGRLQGHPLSIAGVGGGTDYGTLAGIGTGTFTANNTQASFVGGKSYRAVRGDTDISARFANITLVAGHKMRVGMNLIAALGTSWGMRLESNTTGLKILWGFGYTTNMAIAQSSCSFYSDFTVPSGLPDYGYRLRFSLVGASGQLDVGALTIDDLTAMGVA